MATFTPTSQQWADVETALDARDAAGRPYHVLVTGPPGNGKSFAGKRYNVPAAGVAAITLTPDTPGAEVRGHYVIGSAVDPRSLPAPTDRAAWLSRYGHGDGAAVMADGDWHYFAAAALGEMTMAASGSMLWQDGPAIDAWRHGKRLVLDEIGEAAGDVLTLANAIADDPETAGMMLPNGEQIAPADGFQCFGTTNIAADMMPESLIDRFVVLRVSDPHPAGVMALPEDLREFAWHSGTTTDAERRISLRKFGRFASLRATVGIDVALRLAFGERAEEVVDALKVGGGTTTSAATGGAAVSSVSV